MILLEGVVLWQALLAPLLSVVVAGQTLTAGRGMELSRIISLVSAGAWLMVTLMGEVQAGPVAAHGVVGPVGVATSLLVATLDHPIDRRTIVTRHAAVLVALFGLALAAGSGTPVDAASGLALAAGLVVAGAWRSPEATDPMLALGLMGVGAAAMGTAGSGPLLVVGAVMVVFASTVASHRAMALLMPSTLALVVPVVPGLGGGRYGAPLVALGVGVAATLIAWRHLLPEGRGRVPANAPFVLGLWAVATAASGEVSAAWLLGSAAVLATVVTTRVTVGAAAPGLLVFVTGLATEPSLIGGSLRVGLGVLAACSLAGVIVGMAPFPLSVPSLPTGGWSGRGKSAGSALGAWLIIAPATWGWATVDPLRVWSTSPLASWSQGSGPVVAVVMLMATISLLSGRCHLEDLGNFLRLAIAPQQERPWSTSPRSMGQTPLVVSSVVLVLSLMVLVRSLDNIL